MLCMQGAGELQHDVSHRVVQLTYGVKSGIFPSTLCPAGTKRHLGDPLEYETTARGSAIITVAEVRRRTKNFILLNTTSKC